MHCLSDDDHNDALGTKRGPTCNTSCGAHYHYVINNRLTVDDPDDAPGEEEGEDEEGVLHLELRQALQQHQVHDERDHDNHGVKHLVTKLTTSKSTSLFFICQRRRRFIKNNNHKTNNVHK